MSGDFWKLIPVQKHYDTSRKRTAKNTFGDFKGEPKSEVLDVIRPEALEATPYDGFEDAPTHATPYEDFVRGAFRSPLHNTRR